MDRPKTLAVVRSSVTHSLTHSAHGEFSLVALLLLFRYPFFVYLLTLSLERGGGQTNSTRY